MKEYFYKFIVALSRDSLGLGYNASKLNIFYREMGMTSLTKVINLMYSTGIFCSTLNHSNVLQNNVHGSIIK